MKKLILLLACVALPIAASAETPAKTKKSHKAHHTAASPAPAASPAAKASPAPKASPSPEAK